MQGLQEHQGYKKTETGEIPSNWKVVKLNDLCKVVRGGSPRPAGDPKYFGGKIPWITVGQLTKDYHMYLDSVTEGLTELGKDRSRYLEKGIVVIANSGATLGVPKILNLSGCINDGVAAFLNLRSDLLPEFLYFTLFSWINVLRNTNQGIGQPNLNTEMIGNLYFPLPTIEEQRKIASILSKVDELIQKTDQIIEQTQRLKEGLMQTIFSDGGLVTHFKTLTIEEIKAAVPNAISMGPFGSSIKTDNFMLSGIPVIRGVNLTKELFNLDGFVFIKEEKADELRSANAFAGDIVFTHRGTLGQVGIIPDNTKYTRFVISQSQMKLACDRNKAFPLYVYYFFKSPKGQNALLSNVSGTGVPAIGQPTTTLRKIRIPLPPLLEQQKIASILSKVDDLIQKRCNFKDCIQDLKKGLMQKLLTGKIRVKV